MLNHQLIHPKINEVLGRAGHYSTVLIADGNYPAYNARGPLSELVSLNLAPGVVTCTEVLKALVTAIPIQQANTMQYHCSRTGTCPYNPNRRSSALRQPSADNRSSHHLIFPIPLLLPLPVKLASDLLFSPIQNGVFYE